MTKLEIKLAYEKRIKRFNKNEGYRKNMHPSEKNWLKTKKKGYEG